MANYIIIFEPARANDLTGPRLKACLSNAGCKTAPLFNNVWHAAGGTTLALMQQLLSRIAGPGDRFMVVEANDAQWRGIPIPDQAFRGIWGLHR